MHILAQHFQPFVQHDTFQLSAFPKGTAADRPECWRGYEVLQFGTDKRNLAYLLKSALLSEGH